MNNKTTQTFVTTSKANDTLRVKKKDASSSLAESLFFISDNRYLLKVVLMTV